MNTIILYRPFLNAHLLKIYVIIIITVVNALGSFGHDPADYLFAWGSFTAVLLIFIKKSEHRSAPVARILFIITVFWILLGSDMPHDQFRIVLWILEYLFGPEAQNRPAH